MIRFFRFIKALIKYIIWGEEVTQKVYDERIAQCENCTNRCGKRCCVCGCYLHTKAQWSSESCPENKW
mgnify:CR=1 FL=1